MATATDRARDKDPGFLDRAMTALASSNGLRTFLLACAAIGLALAVTGLLILLAGKNPFYAYWALIKGAVGTTGRLAFALNKSTPYILAGVGVAFCFRAKVINIGAEGQIAVGGIAATYIALNVLWLPPFLLIALALVAGALCGAAWAAIAAIIRLKRGVNEVLCTLLLNFVGVLLVAEALHG
ncbi:ABC transporter permease subunit, partial [Pseudorhodoplanes sp.]|uniref:ABC transporter permease subunit n=1 Tax=Pseudorhodoplanes sp. TaxID=1934341 RepID=UPI002C2EB326|nr:hypothetical protein [Pseudorhodoplanes sp.]